MALRVGIDFDNTIVCYDRIFYEAALEKELIPPHIPATKESVKDFLCSQNKESLWIELQGYVYGARMTETPPFPGVIDFFISAVKENLSIYIISHRTRYPYGGPKYDLHKSAFDWLNTYGFLNKNRIGLKQKNVFLKETKDSKLQKIADIGCTHFIDDLLEFLNLGGFPDKTEKILFSPALKPGAEPQGGRIKVFGSWNEISAYFELDN